MYVKQSKTANLLGLANQAIKGTASVLNFGDQLMREKAQSDLFYAQAEMQKAQQDFLQELSLDNKYEDYGIKAENFMEAQKKKLAKRAHNAYQADLYDKLLTSSRDQLYSQVQARMVNKQIEEIGLQNNAAMAMNRQNLKGQNAIDTNQNIIFSEYAGGFRDQTYTKAAVLDNATNCITDDVYLEAAGRINDVINKGESLKDLDNFIDNYLKQNNYTVKMLSSQYANEEGLKKALTEGEGLLDISNEVDKKKIAAQVKKQVQQKYNLELETRQNKNMGTVSQMFNHMLTLTPAEQTVFANNALLEIESKMSGNNLDPSQRIRAVELFKAYADGTKISDKEEKAKEKAEKAKEKAEKDFIKDVIEKDLSSFLNEYLAGEWKNAYSAEEAFKEAVLEEYKIYKNNPEAKKEEMEQEFPQQLGRKFLIEVKNKVKEDPKLKELNGLYEDLENKFKKITEKEKLGNYNELKEGLASLMWDSIYGLTLSNPEEVKKFKEYMTKEVDSYTAKELDYVRKNPITNKFDLNVGVKDGIRKPLLKYLTEIKEHPGMVYTDINGQEQVSIFGNKESLNTAVNLQIQFLKENKILSENVQKEQMHISYESDGRDDVTAMNILEYGGVFYKIRPNEEGTDLDVYVTRRPNIKEEWTKVNTVKQQEVQTKKERKEEIKEIAENAAKTFEPTSFNRPPNVSENREWLRHTQDPKWYAKKIEEIIKIAEKEKDPQKKEKYIKWLTENGIEY